MAALKYWVWLTTLPGLGERAKLQLLAHFGSPEEIYFAPEGELLLAEGITKLQAALLADKSLDRAEKVLEDCARDGQFLLTMDDAGYPARLRNIYDPPLLLYGKGSLPLFDEEAAIAVVGTRSCTPYGLRCAHRMGYELARQGAVVVSGMAKGIDGAAMRGALQAGGFTAAVLGGIGSIPGAMVGGIAIGLCECFVSAIGLSAWKDAVTFAILIIVLLVKPTGFLGRKVQEKV